MTLTRAFHTGPPDAYSFIARTKARGHCGRWTSQGVNKRKAVNPRARCLPCMTAATRHTHFLRAARSSWMGGCGRYSRLACGRMWKTRPTTCTDLCGRRVLVGHGGKCQSSGLQCMIVLLLFERHEIKVFRSRCSKLFTGGPRANLLYKSKLFTGGPRANHGRRHIPPSCCCARARVSA